MENQSESPSSAIFALYFDNINYWCPEEDSNLHILANTST